MASNKTQVAGTTITAEGALDIDGTTVADFAKKSADGAGLSQAEWFKRFQQGVRDYAKANGVDALKNASVTDASSMKGTLDTLYGMGTGSDKDTSAYNSYIYPMMKSIRASNPKSSLGGKPFFYDTGWQYKSSAAHTYSWQEWEPVPADRKAQAQKTPQKKKTKKQLAEEASWVDKDGVTYRQVTKSATEYIDPQKVPFIARRHAPLGAIYKISNPARPDLDPVYAMVLEVSPANVTKEVNGKKVSVDGDTNRIEVSPAVTDKLGIEATPDYVKGDLKAEFIDKGTGKPSKFPTYDEIQELGKKLDKNAKKPAPGKQSSASGASGGAFQLINGEETVRLGVNQLAAAYAGSGCVHTGGGCVVQGSQTVFVGKGQYPFARVTDPTSDGYLVKTGEVSIEIG